MAKLSSDKSYVTAEKGDTLSSIASKFKKESEGKTWQQLAAINNIKKPYTIKVGQKILLFKKGTAPKVQKLSQKVTIKEFGLQTGTDNTLFVTWTWDVDHTSKYQVDWYYDTGDGVWFSGGGITDVQYKQSTYTIPENAKRVKVRVRAVAKKHKVNGKEVYYWTCDWTGYDKTTYTVVKPIEAPSSAPSVEIKGTYLTAKLENLSIEGISKIQFQIVSDDKLAYASGIANIITGVASYSFPIELGHKYKARARSCKTDIGPYSDWTDYSQNEETAPAAPVGFGLATATSKTSILLEWDTVSTATSYTLEWTNDKRNFDTNSLTTKQDNILFGKYEITGLETGKEYFFRVRAHNDKGDSTWVYYSGSVILGSPPSAPTTWSSTTTVMTGEPLTLFWVHNSTDGSSEKKAQIYIHTSHDNRGWYEEVFNTETDEDKKDRTKSFKLDTSKYPEGTEILWKVRTAGITDTYSNDSWSIQRTVHVYATPTITLVVKNSDGSNLNALSSFPLKISATAGPNTQKPIGYHLNIIAKNSYETVDDTGNIKIINSGESVYSKFFNVRNRTLDVTISAKDVNFDNNIRYKIICSASMDSGLTAEASHEFTVVWKESTYFPNAEIVFNSDSVTTNVRPFCEELILERYAVDKAGPEEYIKSDRLILGNVCGEIIPDAKTTTEEDVYYGTTEDGDVLYYCEVIIHNLIEGITLSLYRRDYDGSFVELATGLANTDCTFVTDPHPSLDYARYRVVAIENSTGAVSFYDVPSIPIEENAIVIQWNDAWSNFNVYTEDAMENNPWSGSMLKLPYDIDVSDDSDQDVELIDYIGRKYPVSYYGTKIGHTATWSANIPYDDKETLYGLRRLQSWMGDVYVREPSGTGYWANISVSISQKHCDVKIPVSLKITRVEGGE